MTKKKDCKKKKKNRIFFRGSDFLANQKSKIG